MFALPTSVGLSQRAVAMLVAVALVLMSIGFYTRAEAANLVDVSNTLTDSNLDATSGHDIQFTVPAGSSIGAAEAITITFPAGFGGTAATEVADLVLGDLTVTINGGGPLGTLGGFSAVGQNVSFTLGTTTSALDDIRIVIAEGQVDNPDVTDDYEFVISVANSNSDTGKTRVAILENVLVTAVVNTTFEFTVTGLATSTGVNGTSTTGETTSTLIPFGVLTAGQIETLGQRLNVTTNANSGFAVTVETDGDLESANGAVIDVFDEASDVDDVGTAWNAPVPNVLNETTWGHWGMTTADGDLHSLGGYYTGEFTGNNWIAASTTPRVVFHHNGPSDGVTNNIGSTTVAYQVEITALQEAADDYNTTLTYIATPVF